MLINVHLQFNSVIKPIASGQDSGSGAARANHVDDAPRTEHVPASLVMSGDKFE